METNTSIYIPKSIEKAQKLRFNVIFLVVIRYLSIKVFR